MNSSRTNQLKNEKSPYLLQHQHNPVDWYPWGEAAFKKSRTEQKPIFLSIGYSTCYWCHVMEKECFELQEVADALNKNFVSIKVDREERPEVDSIYMNAIVTLIGHGGWPMSVFLTPELKPFYGGTYFPRPQFLELLGKIQLAWNQQREAITETSSRLTDMIRTQPSSPDSRNIDEKILALAFDQIGSRFDPQDGGFGPAPKFPAGMMLMMLLRGYVRTGEEHLLVMATRTLEKMACGGIYDHLGGGFHRYAVDTKWLVPHFEKMLYDNAQLALAYLEAYQLTANPLFGEVAQETLEYVLRDMSSPEGAFFSAEDAGEVGKEGEFYLWSQSEIKSALSDAQAEILKEVFRTTEAGNFEGRNILHLKDAADWAKRSSPEMKAARETLLSIREKRERPHRDDKILTAWNGLMIAAFAKGYEVLMDRRYLVAAENAARFLHSQLWEDGKLKRRYRDGEAKIEAVLEDYTFLIFGLIQLYEVSAVEDWLAWADELQQTLDSTFWDAEQGGYYRANPADADLIIQQKDFPDGAEPSGNGIGLLNLTLWSALGINRKTEIRRDELLRALPETFERYPSAFCSTLLSIDFLTDSNKQVIVSGYVGTAKVLKFQALLGTSFLPNKVVAYSNSDAKLPLGVLEYKENTDEKVTFSVCEHGACQLPTDVPDKAIELLKARKKYEL